MRDRLANLRMIRERCPSLATRAVSCARDFQFHAFEAEDRYQRLVVEALKTGDWLPDERERLLAPPVYDEQPERRSAHLTMRVTPSEKERIRRASQRAGMSIADLVLRLLDDGKIVTASPAPHSSHQER